MGIFDKLFGNSDIKKRPWVQYYTKEEKKLKITDKTIFEFLKESIPKEYYNYTALNYFDKKITYGQFFNRVKKTSKALLAIGVRPGDVVTICMPNTPEAVISFYAVNSIGAVSNMVHPLSAKEEIKNYLKESKSRVLIMIDTVYEKIEDILSETLVYKTIVVSPKDSMPKLLALGYIFTR